MDSPSASAGWDYEVPSCSCDAAGGFTLADPCSPPPKAVRRLESPPQTTSCATPDTHLYAASSSDSMQTHEHISVLVPTAFTTAQGRPICVCETRAIAKNSPYWNLLFSPDSMANRSRESILAECCAENQTTQDAATSDCTKELDTNVSAGKPPAWFRRPGEWNSDGPLPFSPPRAASCPERVHSSPPPSLASSPTPIFTFPYTGFTRADGSMLYHHPHLTT